MTDKCTHPFEAQVEVTDAEEPDGSQCDTCDEYSDACVCVCAVEDQEEGPAEERRKEADMGIEMLWPEEGK